MNKMSTYIAALAFAATAACGSSQSKIVMYMPPGNVDGKPIDTCVILDAQGEEFFRGEDYGYDDLSDKVTYRGRVFVRRAESSTLDDWMLNAGATPDDVNLYHEVKVNEDGDIIGYVDPYTRYDVKTDCSHRKPAAAFKNATDARVKIERKVFHEDGTVTYPDRQ